MIGDRREVDASEAPDGEAGFTLVEVMVTASLLVVVLAMVMTALFSVQKGFGQEVTRAESVDQARLASEQIQHEVLSSRAVTVEPDGLTMDVYTRTNETTRAGQLCVQWEVAGGELRSRRWTPPWTAGEEATWRSIATGIRNTTADPMFELDPNPVYADRLVNLTVLTNADPSKGRDVVIETSVLGRNITYNAVDPCAIDQPPD